MGKNTEINFVGQPIFVQILKLIDKWLFVSLVKEKKSDHYYKAFRSWDQLIIMLFRILSKCDSMAETCEGLKALVGKLNHPGLQRAPAKSTAGDGLRNRDSSFFEALYYKLVEQYFDITAEEAAFIYKKRRQIELLFKKMKQNFQLHYFKGENENAFRTQVLCTLIAQLLLTVIQKMANVK
jgi:IS4 transposase